MKTMHFLLIMLVLAVVVVGNCMAEDRVANPAQSSPVLKLSRFEGIEKLLQMAPGSDEERLSLASDDFFLRDSSRTKVHIDFSPSGLLALKQDELRKILKELDLPLLAAKNTNVRLKVRGSQYMAIVSFKF